MRIFRHYEDIPPDLQGGAVAIGNFDGVHKGHQAVINEAGTFARRDGRPWGVLTFEPHPVQVFRPDQAPFRLTPFRIKCRHIEELGVDFLLALHFDKAFSQHTAPWFVDEVIRGSLAARHMVSGYDFVFGHGRQGNCQMLLESGARDGFDFTCVRAVTDDGGDPYSSTRVRQALWAGDVAGARDLLGWPFEIEGRVEQGDQRGRTIGFPTANLHLGEYIRPAYGVYAVRAGIDLGVETKWVDGVANLGVRPTFDTDEPLLEVHLFDTDLDLYGKHLRVALIDRIRPEQRFDGLDALKAQITKDCAIAKTILAA